MASAEEDYMEDCSGAELPPDDARRLVDVATLLAQAARILGARAEQEGDAQRRYLLQDTALGALVAAGRAGALLDEHASRLEGGAEDPTGTPSESEADPLLRQASALLAEVKVLLPALPALRKMVAELLDPGTRP